jgi:hypothetical protein
MHRSRLGNIVIDCRTDDLLPESRAPGRVGSPYREGFDQGANAWE